MNRLMIIDLNKIKKALYTKAPFLFYGSKLFQNPILVSICMNCRCMPDVKI